MCCTGPRTRTSTTGLHRWGTRSAAATEAAPARGRAAPSRRLNGPALPAQILWLKTLINVLFSFGRAAEPEDTLYNWHVWMSILLSASVLPPPRPARGRPLGAGR